MTTKRKRDGRRLAGILAAAILLAGEWAGAPDRARAQTLPDTTKAVLEEIVVTAHRVPVERDRISSRVTVLPGDELRARGIRFVAEALRDVPGVSAAGAGPFGAATSLFLRGGESDYVQVLVDGVPVNRPGGAFDFARLTTENVQRVEVLRGPASVLYGSDAMAGVVQIFTRAGDGPPRARTSVRGGSYGTLAWEGDVSGGGDVADYSLSLSRFTSDGLYDFNNRYGNTVASGRVRLTPDLRTRADLSLRYSSESYRFPTNGAGAPVDENQRQLRDATLLSLEVTRDLSRRLTAGVRVANHATDLAFDDRPDGPGDTTGVYAFESQEDLGQWQVEGRVNWRPGPGTVLTAGAAVEEASRRSISRSMSSFGSSTATSDDARGTRALFVQALTRPADELSLSAGARLDDADAFGSFATYRAGAVYELPTGTRLRASYGTGFKAPTFVENFARGFARGNPELEPERSRSWEAGLDQRFADGRIRVVATYFHQAFRDLIQFTFQPPETGAPNFFNVAAADARGVELEADVEITEELRIGGSYTWLQTEVTDAGFDQGTDAAFVAGERLLRRPTHAASLRATWTPEGGGSFSAAVRRVGDRADRDFSEVPAERVVLPAHTTVDLAARYPLLGGEGPPALSPLLRVENALDARYQEIVNFPARGRTVFVGLTAELGL